MPRVLLGFLALSVAALLLAGCGSTPTTAPVLDDLAQVADRSAAADSASFALRADEKLGAQTFSVSASGAFDSARDRARVSVDLSSLAKAFAGLGSALGAPKGALKGFGDPANWKLELRSHGKQVYISSPLLTQALPAGKTWVSGDLEKLGSEHGVDLGQLGGLDKTDPRDLLDLLRAASGGLDTVGTETLRGVETTHYRTTLDAEDIVSQIGKDLDDSMAAQITQAIEQSGLDEIPIDVWVDGDSLLRRLDTTIAAQAGGRSSSSTLSLELYDYGKPVDVTPPPAEQVASVDTLRAHG